MKKVPKISIITPTLNNEKNLPRFIESIKKQNYSKNKIEVLFIDGGSKDKTLTFAKKNKIKVIPNPAVLAEPAVNIGIENAHGDLIMILATDNYFNQTNALTTIANVFKNPQVYAAFPKHESEQEDNIYTKYHNTFTDPFNHFIYGNASNARTFKRIYKTLFHSNEYDIYDYKSNKALPMIALAQGFTIRSSYHKLHEDIYDDCKPIYELIHDNKKIAYVHSIAIFHKTTKSLGHFIRKQQWATQNALERKKFGIAHRFKLLSREQRIKMYFWPIYGFTFIFPFLRALQGIIEDKNVLWLFHPYMCFISCYASFTQIINKRLSVSRQ